jgi:hypothetical protein
MHGYDYKFIRGSTPKDRHVTWVKVPALASILSSYKFVVFLDADALFNQMHIPVEWFLNYWSITPTTSLALALDPPEPQNNDTSGRRYANTGFVIAQNNPKTHEILKALDECPDEGRYKGCGKFRKEGFHEQGAFGSYVRYDYDDYIKELPCNEANGEWDLESCKGVFVQHMWWRTPTVRKHFGDETLQALMARMHGHAMKDKKMIVDVQGA